MNTMTGYGKGVGEKDGRKVVVELRSVNHRFLDVSLKLPKTMGFAEDVIRKRLSAGLSRGHVDVFLSYENTRTDSVKLTVNEGLASEYVRVADFLAKQYGVVEDYSVSALIKTADVVALHTEDEDENAVGALVAVATEQAIAALIAMRRTEGAALQKDMLSKADYVKELLDKVSARAPKVAEQYRVKLKERISDALSGLEVDETRLINEVAFFCDKCCIDEEIQRLGTHIVNLKATLIKDEPIGRQLDFLVQEMNREANTIGSKSNDMDITAAVLLIKNEIEKIREQVQNIE